MPELKKIAELARRPTAAGTGTWRSRASRRWPRPAPGRSPTSPGARRACDLSRVRAGALIVASDSPHRLRQPHPGGGSAAGLRPAAGIFSPAAAVLDGRRRQRLHLGKSPAGDRCQRRAFFLHRRELPDRGQHGDPCQRHHLRDVTIGRDCLIYANVVIRENVEIGDRVIIHPGAVIGADGFGFGRAADGSDGEDPPERQGDHRRRAARSAPTPASTARPSRKRSWKRT